MVWGVSPVLARFLEVLSYNLIDVLVNFKRDRTLISVIKNGIQFYFMVLTVFRIKTIRANFFLTSYLFINF